MKFVEILHDLIDAKLRWRMRVDRNHLSAGFFPHLLQPVFAVNTYDSAGNEITSPNGSTIVVTAATGSTVGGAVDCTGAYNSTDGVYYCQAQASATNAAVTTADNSETYTFKVGTVSATAAVKFVSGVLTTVSVAAPATADPGSKIVYTITALGANGNALPDGAYSAGSIFTAADPTVNASLVVKPIAAAETITLTNGVGTSFTYAPYGGTLSASWTLAGTAATAQSVVGVGSPVTYYTSAGIAKALTATTVAANDVAVSGSTDATDAANAATDAANAAADAADNATQAASEALAAVNSLATTVASLIAGIKAQITSLTNLITKIKNKVGA